MSDNKIAGLLKKKKNNWFQVNIVSNAPSLIAVFANFVVLFADYRVYDVMYQMTGSWWKALSASLACAVPFILWEIGWQYNHTTENWRLASLLMAGLAFVTSIVLGVADYVGFTAQYADILLGGVVVLTGVHTVVGLLYYYNDPDVARVRREAQALATMRDQELNAQLAEQLLADGDSLLATIKKLEGKYDPDDVADVLAILNGERPKDKPANRNQQSLKLANTYAKDVSKVNPQKGRE